MYTGSYYPDGERTRLPEGYDGCAFGQADTAQATVEIAKATSEPKISPRDGALVDENDDVEAMSKKDDDGGSWLGSLFQKLPFSGFLEGKRLGPMRFDTFKLGTEEILLIAVALFLLFTKNGDKECAIILLCLLFVR